MRFQENWQKSMMLYHDTFRGTTKLFLSLKATVDVIVCSKYKNRSLWELFSTFTTTFVINLPFSSGHTIVTWQELHFGKIFWEVTYWRIVKKAVWLSVIQVHHISRKCSSTSKKSTKKWEIIMSVPKNKKLFLIRWKLE